MPTNQAATPSGAEILSFNTLTQVQSDWSQSNPAEPSFIRNKPSLPTYDVLFSGTATNAATGLTLNPFDYDELKLFLNIGGVNRIYSLGMKGIAGPFTLVLKVYDGASNLWERWIQMTFTTTSATVNATKRYKMGTISNTTATASDVATSTSASDLQFISKIVGINY